jgi:hypothetical protein
MVVGLAPQVAHGHLAVLAGAGARPSSGRAAAPR